MGDIKIEKGVARPRVGGRKKYPFGDMEVDDSFAVPVEISNHVRAAASYYGIRNGKKFSVCKYGDAYRCWRIG